MILPIIKTKIATRRMFFIDPPFFILPHGLAQPYGLRRMKDVEKFVENNFFSVSSVATNKSVWYLLISSYY